MHGNNVPGCYASEAEVLAMAQAARRAGYAVYETAGAPGDKGLEGLLEIGKQVTVTFTLPEAGMSRSLEWLQKANAGDSTVIGQVFARAQGLLLGLEGVIQVRDDPLLTLYHAGLADCASFLLPDSHCVWSDPLCAVPQPFSVRSETFLAMRHKPLPEIVAQLREPAVRAAILDEYDASEGAGVPSVDGDPLPYKVSENFENMWVMNGGGATMAFDYEPEPSISVAALAEQRGVRPQEIILDAMLEDDGKGVVWYPYAHGYSERNYDNVRIGMEGCEAGLCVMGNADAGAHVAAFTDAVSAETAGLGR